jgi:hypothetical protein
MRGKTIFIILLTAIVTIFLVSNTDEVEFNFIFTTKDISKLVVIGVSTYDVPADPTTKDSLSADDRNYIS